MSAGSKGREGRCGQETDRTFVQLAAQDAAGNTPLHMAVKLKASKPKPQKFSDP